ncbi:MAG TPA: histidine kinase [Prolixibacteraceae bacterium]|nr:histidine kinase [Prolixibacteraceae bacterium]
MKIFHIKKQLFTLLHLIFWFISFNFWTVILNPGVESSTVIDGMEVDWSLILLLNLGYLLYCSLPAIWLFKKPKLWIKISLSVLFLIPLGIVISQWLKPNEQNDYVVVLADYFVKNFLYVLIFHLTIISAVYYNLKILIPRFFSRSRFNLYLLSAVGLSILAALLNYSLFDLFIDQLFPSLYFISYFKIWELILIVAGYLLFTSVLFLIGQYALMLIANRDAAQHELSALKAQINPHFLFNNLNTIYSMAAQHDERTADVILKLSDFLRYVLYDTTCETIPLEKEAEIIRTYVGLQKERVNPEITHIIFDVEGDLSTAEISPLLLLPLAENCFKHGIGKDYGIIKIYIGYDGTQLIFKTENNLAPREKTDSKETVGIGIRNVEKRLNLIYPQQHSLEYHVKEGIFILEMKIELGKTTERIQMNQPGLDLGLQLG